MAAHPQPDLDVADSGGSSSYTLVAGTGPEGTTTAGALHLTLVTDTPARTDRFDRLRRRCPSCGRLGVRIVYGELRGALEQAAAQGRIVRGGYIHRAATHRCPRAHEWECTDIHR